MIHQYVDGKRYFIFKARRVGMGGVFKSFVEFKPGKVIDVASTDSIQFIEFEPYTDHKKSLAILAGI